MPYIGRAATNAGSVNYLDDISSGFDGNDVTFTCAVNSTTITPGQENVYIYLDGVFQHPGESYTISGSTITFTEAPVSGVDFTGYVAGEGAYLDDGTVSTAKLDDDAVTASKLDDDGTGFQVGDLGVGGSLTSGDKLTVTGRLRASGGIIGDLTGDVTGDLTGNVTGNVTGNTSGTAATVTEAAQTAITSVGTLTSLTVDNITLNSSDINNSTGNFTFSHGGSEKLRITSDKVMFTADAKVDANNTRDLGTSGTRWKDLYLAGNANVGGGATITGNVTIGGSLQSDDFTIDAGAGNPDLVIKTTASSSATAQMLFLTGNKDFTLVNDTDNFRLYNSTPGVGVDVFKVVGSSSDILFGDVGNSRHVSLDYSNGDFVVNQKLGVGVVPPYKFTVKSGGAGQIAQGFVLLNNGDSNIAGTLFEESISGGTCGELRLNASNSTKVYLRANSNSSSAFWFKGGQMQDITANNTGIQFRANWDTGFLNRIDNNFDGASADSSYMRFKVASGAGSQNTALTLFGDGDVTVHNTFAVTANHSNDWGTELFNASSTGHGAKIRGGSTSSHYSLFVSNHDQTLTVLSCLADGTVTAGSKMVAPYFRTYTSATSVANGTWTNLSGLTSLGAGLYMIHVYKDNYAANDWSARGIVEATGHSTIDGDFENQSGFQLRVNGSNVQLYHTLGQTFGITSTWVRIA